jgi:SPP1 family predicted phage head-tail adaptor
VRAGLLRDRIDIETNTPTRNGLGEEVVGWATLYSSQPATITPLRSGKSRETKMGGAITSETSHRISIRYKSGITTADRVKFGSLYYDIEIVIDVRNRNRMLELMCKERA